MKKISRLPLITSTLAFVLAGMLVITIHELSHLVMSLSLGVPAILFPNFVVQPDQTTSWQIILTAGTGPLFSLISGLLIIWLIKDWLKGSSKTFTKLLVLWFGFLSAEVGFGYFFIAPLVAGGDTGQVLSLLNASWFVYAIIFAAGVAGFLLLLPRVLSARLSSFAHDKSSFFQLSMFPWLIGTGILLVIYTLSIAVTSISHIDAPGLIALMGVVTIGVFAPMADFNKLHAGHNKNVVFNLPVAGIVMSSLIGLFIIFILSRGIHFGL
ncbi:MAG: hypothetical protein ABIQ04_03820 [Candidatus Saccharimonadales bacterium]